MTAFSFLKEKVQERQEKKKVQNERLGQLRAEAEEMEKIEFERQFLKDSKKVAIKEATSRSNKLSGLNKMRAMERAEKLKMQQGTSGGFRSKLAQFSAHTSRNRERTMKLRELSKKKRALGKSMREEQIAERRVKVEKRAGLRPQPKTLQRKPFKAFSHKAFQK